MEVVRVDEVLLLRVRLLQRYLLFLREPLSTRLLGICRLFLFCWWSTICVSTSLREREAADGCSSIRVADIVEAF